MMTKNLQEPVTTISPVPLYDQDDLYRRRASASELAKDFIEDGVEFTMDTTTSVDEAIRRVINGDYDAVICDYQMPAMNGVGFNSSRHCVPRVT